MNLRAKKRLIARMAKVSAKRVWIDPGRISDVKEAITREDFRGLVRDGVVMIKQKKGSARSRARVRIEQRKKGRMKGRGKKKGKKGAFISRKERWMLMVRAQRKLADELKKRGLILKSTGSMLRKKISGGFFRSRRHIKLFLTEKDLWVRKEKKEEKKEERKEKEKKLEEEKGT